jgi:DNA-binding SARP family transcriptional activator/TolB-like protein
MALFRVELLGGCRVLNTTTDQEVVFRTRKAKCLLGILLLSPAGAMNREQLASLLWDPAPEDMARGSLRQSLKELRDTLGEGAVTADRFTVALVEGAFVDDVRAFRDLIAASIGANGADREAALRAAALWKGELFGAVLPSAIVFEAWVQIERSHLRSALTKALTDHLEALIAAGDFGDARLAEELVRIEPSHELAHQYLMRFHALRGDQSAALRQFALLERALEEELDSEPCEDSNALLVAIKRGDIALQRSEPPPRPARQGPPRITIRPPLTRFSDTSKDYLGEGFAYLAKSCLSRFRCWIVIPWPNTGYGSPAAVDYAAVGQAIQADFAVDCVLDWRAPACKLFVTLVDCRDGSEVWSRIYAISEYDLAELSSSVAGAVAAHLAAQVNYISLLRYARSSPGDPVAYDLWLRGHQLSRQWDPQADIEAEALFARSIGLDAGLACAHSSLAQILNTRSMVRPGYPGARADYAAAFKHAQSAIALDPYDARSHISMAWSWMIAGSAERANSHFRLAVDLNPHDSETLISAANGMAFLGKADEAAQWSNLALTLNPIYPEYYSAYLAGIHFMRGDYRATVAAVEKCPDVFPDLVVWAAAAWALLGQEAEAGLAYQSFSALTARIWEGPQPPTEDGMEDWLLAALPIVWAQGRQGFAEGIRLARQMAHKPLGLGPQTRLSGTGA